MRTTGKRYYGLSNDHKNAFSLNFHQYVDRNKSITQTNVIE